jgi:hypothetical protein
VDVLWRRRPQQCKKKATSLADPPAVPGPPLGSLLALALDPVARVVARVRPAAHHPKHGGAGEAADAEPSRFLEAAVWSRI